MKPVASFLALCMLATVADAEMPACGIRSGKAGGPAILINESVYAPIFFGANNQFGRDDILLDELRLAAQAGIPFFTLDLPLPWRDPENKAAETLDTFCAAHPEGYFYLRLSLGAPKDWCEAHPDECVTTAAGERLGMASPVSEVWREDAGAQLRACIAQVLSGPHANRFIGVALQYLQTAEWFYPRTDEYMDYSEAAAAAFQAWLKKTYGREKALRRAWAQPEASFGNAALPTPEAREAAAWGPFRSPQTQQPVIDHHRFQQEAVADTITLFARVVKETTGGRALVGAFYGYTFELNGNGPRALAHSGHLALARLLECPDLDILHAPYSYYQRALGEPGTFHGPMDSIALHGKLAIIEEDTYTHLAMEPPPGIIAPGWQMRAQSMEQTLALSRRNFGNFLTHRCGFWFFDLLSDGRWNARQVWDGALLARRIAAEIRSAPAFAPEVAFVASEEAVSRLADTTQPLLLQSLGLWRREIARIGAPVGYYLQSDLPRLPGSVRLVVLANPYATSRAERDAVRDLLKRGAVVVVTYAPDIVGEDGPDLGRIRRFTGFEVSEDNEVAPNDLADAATQETYHLDGPAPEPRLVITGGGDRPLLHYAGTEKIAAAIRAEGKGQFVYTAAPRLPLSALVALCDLAGVHRYRETPGMTGVAGPYLWIHTDASTPETPARFAWPTPISHVVRVVPANLPPVSLQKQQAWSDSLPPNTTALYHCE